jgi:hypothetical protein
MTIKIKGRGKDKKKRKSRKTTQKSSEPEEAKPNLTQKSSEPEEAKPNLLRGIIDTISKKVKREREEPWSLDIGPRVESKMLGRHVFKGEKIEINLDNLQKV